VIHNNYNLVILYKEVFGGDIYIISNNRYIWSICSQDQVSNFSEYVKKYTLRSNRHKRFFLLPKFYNLVNINAHKASKDSKLSKAWLIFNNKFNRYTHY
jgi:hypothetical protein